MLSVQLTEKQVENLNVFLSRVELRGSEAVALVEIAQAIQSAKPVESKTE